MSLIRSEARRTGHDSPAGVLTALAVTTQTIAVIGPSLGGLLIGLGGWRTTLALNIPLALAGIALGLLRLPRTPPPERADGERRLANLDLTGMGLFAVMLISLLVFLMEPAIGHLYLLGVVAVAAAVYAILDLKADRA